MPQQFAGFGNIFIMPDQAAVSAAYNPNNPGALNNTADLGAKLAPARTADRGDFLCVLCVTRPRMQSSILRHPLARCANKRTTPATETPTVKPVVRPVANSP